MKNYRGFPYFVWALLGLLAIAGAILSLGQRESIATPSAYSYAPSGVAAFADLLRQTGYKVRVDRWPHPRLAADEVPLVFRRSVPVGLSSDQENDFAPFLDKYLRDGGHAIVFTVPTEFAAASRALLKANPPSITERGAKQSLKVFTAAAETVAPESTTPPVHDDGPWDGEIPVTPPTLSVPDVSVGLWDNGGEPFLRARQLGKGRSLEVSNGAFATNRFLDRADDAKAALQIVSLFARPGKRLVFTEAAFGNAEAPGLLEVIGPWANAGWQQLLFLGLVVGYTLGKRFGIPDETRSVQVGARELVDALSDTYRRGRQSKAAMLAAYERSNTEIRTALRLPRDASKEDRNRHLPASLKVALASLEAAVESSERVRSSDALDLVAKARTETLRYLGRR